MGRHDARCSPRSSGAGCSPARFILIVRQRYSINPVEKGHGFDKSGVAGESTKAITDRLLYGIECGKCGVAKPVFLEVIPDMLGGVELGAVGREPEQTNGGRDAQVCRAMPARLVKYHDAEVMRIEAGGVRQEDGHGFVVAPRHDQARQATIMWTHRTKRIDGFAHHLP